MKVHAFLMFYPFIVEKFAYFLPYFATVALWRLATKFWILSWVVHVFYGLNARELVCLSC